MVRTLRDSKAQLSKLVALASRGEDVLIKVRGKVKARLTQASARGRASSMPAWAGELRSLQKAYSARAKPSISIEEILASDREDRV